MNSNFKCLRDVWFWCYVGFKIFFEGAEAELFELMHSVQMMTSLHFAGGLLMCVLGQACFTWLKNTLSLPNTESIETNKKFLLISVGFGSLLCSAGWNNKTKHKTSWSEFPLVCFAAEYQCGVIHPLSALPSKVLCVFYLFVYFKKVDLHYLFGHKSYVKELIGESILYYCWKVDKQGVGKSSQSTMLDSCSVRGLILEVLGALQEWPLLQ